VIHHQHRKILLASALALFGVIFAGCASASSPDGAAQTNSSPVAAPAKKPASAAAVHHHHVRVKTASISPVESMLRDIRVAPETQSAGYDRAEFPLWIEQNGCSTRQDVLLKESKRGVDAACQVNGGKWFSAYDGLTTSDPSKFDIDHFVPLEQAYVSGASRWNLATRTRFANDLGYGGSLRAVSATSNRSKGDEDPAHWLPPRTAFRCKYIGTWIAVKFRWRLTADSDEKQTLKQWATRCGSRADVPVPHRAIVRFSKHPAAAPKPATQKHGSGKTDPRFATCAIAKAHGDGPYRRGVDPEYNWYRDADGDGIVCE
jgi:rRNA maturation protein Nop10